jgi:hypothetical protein
MLNFFRISSRVDELEKAFAQLKQEMNFYKDDFEKLEIKALESRKIYGKKLKQLVEKEEKPESKGIYNGVFLTGDEHIQQD